MKLQIDSPFITIGTRITNLLILNFYWILGCLPIITIGTSTIAAFSVTLKMVEDRESPSMTSQFWHAYVKNLRHGIPLTLILGVVLYSVWIDMQCFNNLQGNPIGFLILAIAAIVLLVLHFLYIFPLEARYENTLLQGLTNSRRIFVRFFLRSLSLLGILFVQYLIFLRTAPVLTYIGLFCGPILAIYTVSQVAMPVFRRLEGDSHANDGFTVTGGN